MNVPEEPIRDTESNDISLASVAHHSHPVLHHNGHFTQPQTAHSYISEDNIPAHKSQSTVNGNNNRHLSILEHERSVQKMIQ